MCYSGHGSKHAPASNLRCTMDTLALRLQACFGNIQWKRHCKGAYQSSSSQSAMCSGKPKGSRKQRKQRGTQKPEAAKQPRSSGPPFSTLKTSCPMADGKHRPHRPCWACLSFYNEPVSATLAAMAVWMYFTANDSFGRSADMPNPCCHHEYWLHQGASDGSCLKPIARSKCLSEKCLGRPRCQGPEDVRS